MKFYEIEAQLKNCFDEETGEIINPELFEELGLAWDTKVEGIAIAIKQLRAEAKAIKEEKQSLEARQKQKENKADNLQNFLQGILNGQKFETPKVAITWRKSEKLIIDDGSRIPEEYLRHKEPEVDKTELKKAIKAGAEIDGAHLEESQNMQLR